jgi:NitT/TauT family transport system substrate-binding protein
MSDVRLTPVAKGLIALTILAVFAAVAWRVLRKDEEGASTGGAAAGSGTAAQQGGPPGSGSLGSASNPLKVSIVSFHGYAPALVANGKSLKTASGSIFDKAGVQVEFVIQDDIPTLPTIFESGAAHCAWRTSDFWAQEHPNLRNAGHDGRAVVVVDNTQGGDAVIARDASIQRIEDLAGKKVALLQYTPSHGMLIDALDNSSLTARQRTKVEMVFVNAEEGTAGVRAALVAGHVDAAVLWDPDLSLALKAIPGAHVVYSTASATNLIYDVIVCDQRVLKDPKNEPAIQAFVKGWLEGVEAAEKSHDEAIAALVETEEFFKLLAKDQGKDFVKGLFKNLVWTGLDDNARILGLAGGINYYENVYRRFDGIYRAAGALANPSSPVIPPGDSFDYRFVKALLAQKPEAKKEAEKPEFTFTEEKREEAAKTKPALTRPVLVGFPTGSSELDKAGKEIIDKEMVPLVEAQGAAYFEVSGNTDSTGSSGVNQPLSEKRARAVVEYLVTQWEFPRERFKVVGNGPSKPLCNEKAPEEGMSLEECRARNRTTRVAVHKPDEGKN